MSTLTQGPRPDSAGTPAPGDTGERERLTAALIGTRIGKYEIVRIVGRGGMGCVYEAVNTSIKKRVAMKCIDHELANEEAYERFHREALAASSIESPHIVQIFDAGKTEEGVPYIVMELLRGADLGQYLARQSGKLPVNDALHVVVQILKGLHHAHAAGIVHRDLKPDNVFLVAREDEPSFVKLLDFGVSKISRSTDVPLQTLTRQGTVVGTPFYMSPEQAQAFPDVDGRTDLYSVGAILYECLTKRPPHVGKSYEQVIVNICMNDADDVRTHNPQVPESVSRVIVKALSREREDRYESAREMLAALVDAAPESFRHDTPSSKLKAISLGTSDAMGGPHTPMVISPPPGSKPANVLADTINIEDAQSVRTLSESGIRKGEATVEARRETLPSDAIVPSRRRWALAAAPGVAFLLAMVLYLSFSQKRGENSVAPAPEGKHKSSVAADKDKAEVPAEDAPPNIMPGLAPPSPPRPFASVSAAPSTTPIDKKVKPRPQVQPPSAPVPNAKPPQPQVGDSSKPPPTELELQKK